MIMQVLFQSTRNAQHVLKRGLITLRYIKNF